MNFFEYLQNILFPILVLGYSHETFKQSALGLRVIVISVSVFGCFAALLHLTVFFLELYYASSVP